MARATSPEPWAVDQLVEIVGDRWQAGGAQADALAAMLSRALPPQDLVALGEVWEAAEDALSRQLGPLTQAAAGHLVAAWLRLGADRADGRRPRGQRPEQGWQGVRPTGDISGVMARWARS
jgi:hypothetical protein